MRLYVFDDHRLGVQARADAIVDITSLVSGDVSPHDRMTALICNWDNLEGAVSRAAGEAHVDHLISRVTVRAPQPRPGTIVAAAVNYKRHHAEMGGASGVYAGADIKTIETYVGFVKASSSIVGPDAAIELPYPDRRVDHEAEVGVVIGRRANRVARAEALDYVFGYVPLLDITIRGEEDRSIRKSYDTFTPIGPAIVTADEIADPAEISFQLSVNGEQRQKSTTANLIYDIPRLVELYSETMTLHPGDIIATGTPEGVGPLAAGDKVVLSIDGIGELSMPVINRS